jgi:hypothetical protein
MLDTFFFNGGNHLVVDGFSSETGAAKLTGS